MEGVAVSVPELARAGLSVQRLATLDLTVGFAPKYGSRFTLYRLAHRGPLVPGKTTVRVR
jgi:hypothetical protein